MPLDCYMKDNLDEVDGKIKKEPEKNKQDHFRFPVYRLTVENDRNDLPYNTSQSLWKL